MGSWGRLAARLGDHETAEAILEHRAAFLGPVNQTSYVHEHIGHPGRYHRASAFRIAVATGRPDLAVVLPGLRAQAVVLLDSCTRSARRDAGPGADVGEIPDSWGHGGDAILKPMERRKEFP